MDEFRSIQRDIEMVMAAREDLDVAEEIVDSAPGLTTDERSALWLYAWSLLPRHRQLAEAHAHLHAVAARR